jgi:hypothetical protein
MTEPSGSAIAKYIAVEIQRATAPLLARIEKLERAMAEADKKPDAMQRVKSLFGGAA